MTTADLATLLIERSNPVLNTGGKELNPKLSAYYDRLLLRIHGVPSLLSYLADAAIVPSDDEESVKVQLDFLRLPDEFLPQLPQLLASPTKPHYFRFVKDGQARLGVEITLKPEDFPGDQYDWAF